MAVTSVDGLDEQVLNELVAQGNLDFDDWITLITSYEHMYHDDIDKISLVYNSFLSEFPLCHGYWKKYAEHTARLCGVENVVPIFERAVEAVPYSVGVWVDYCSFGISSFEEPSDVRRLFERGLSFVGKDYLCHYLWDKYIEFEYSHEQWNSLACIYIYTLKFPTKKLHQYYESFKKLVAIWKEDLEFQGISQEEEQSEHDTDSDIVAEDAKISHFISDLIDPSTRAKALQKYISVGEFFYQRACNMDAKLNKFEQNIRRPYFHVKPLDDNQLRNWHQYLDLVEMEGDFDWVVKLYERCLIPCAHYPEFWMRYVDFVESKGGSEIASDALKRATHIFLKNVSDIHLFNAWCKEKVNDIDGAHASYLQCDQDFGSCFVDRIRKKANFERRMGNNASASSIYKKAIEVAAEKRPDTLPMLYVHFARLQYMITDSVDATREVLLNGIQRVPQSKLLFEELILFALMHDGARQVDHLESVMAQALTLGTELSGGLSNKDQEDISKLYLEFIDTCGSIHDIRRAWKRHSKLFPHLVRVQPTHKKPAKAGDMWKMVVEGRPDSCSTDPQKSSKEFDKNHLAQMPPPGKVLVPENLDKSEQNGQSEFADDNSNQNDVKQGTLNFRKTFVKDDFKANVSGAEVFHRASDDRNPEEAIKDSKSHAILGVQEQDQRSQQEKISSLEGRSLNSREDEYNNINASLSQGLEAPREASRYNESTRAGGHDVDEIPSISSPASPRENIPAETCNDSPCPSSRMRHKDPSSTVSPDRPSDREGNRRHFNSSGKGRSRPNSPVASAERQERSLSPRRRNSHGNFDDRRHRERSLSPRRRNSRWNSEERWHRDRRNRRFSRYQDNARGQRDVRMQNQNVGVIGSTGQTQTAQQQSILGYPQAPTNQYPLPINEQYGTVQNNQLYNMWQYYYYNQQQQQQFLPQQPPSGSQQQLQQMQPSQQLQQQVQNSASQQHMQTPQQLQQTPPNQQQLLHLPYQQQQLYQQLQFQQQLTNEQPECQQQQLQAQQQFSQQQLVLQPQQQQQVPIQQQQLTQLQQQQVPLQQQQQTQLQQQDEVYLQQQQQSYQYQQQQYLLYLQQLHQYQQSQQQSGIAPDQKSFQQQQSLAEDQQKELPELEQRNVKAEFQQDDVSTQVDSVSCSQQRQEMEDIHGLTSQALTQDELPEIEGTDI